MAKKQGIASAAANIEPAKAKARATTPAAEGERWEQKNRRCTIWLPAALWEQLGEEATQTGQTRSAIIRQAIEGR